MNYPVSIEVEGKEISLRFESGGAEQIKTLCEGEIFRIFDKSVKSLQISYVTNKESIPPEYVLYQNYPNPFNPATKIRFGLPEEGLVNITVFNILGESVKEVVNDKFEAGYHEVEFNASNLASGIYFYRIICGKFVKVKRMSLLR